MTVTPFTSYSLPDLARLKFPPVEWIIDGVVPRGALVLLVGRPKMGKSLLAIDMLVSVALGETFLDRATAQGPVVYVPAEDALRAVRDRVFTRIGSERTAPLHVVPADGSIDQSIRLDDPESFFRLAATLDDIQPSLVVLDPFRELHRGRENESDDMAGVLRPLRQLAHERDTTIVLIHHRNKQASDPAKATRGSTAIAGSVDVVMVCDSSRESDTGGLTPDHVVTIHVEGRYGPRMNLGARLGPGLRWHPANPQESSGLPAGDKLLRHLEMAGGMFTADELVTETGLAARTIQNTLPALVKNGRIVRQGTGKRGEPYRYHLAGWEPENAVGDNVGEKLSASISQKEPFSPATHDPSVTSVGGDGSGDGDHRSRPCCRARDVQSVIPLATMTHCLECTRLIEDLFSTVAPDSEHPTEEAERSNDEQEPPWWILEQVVRLEALVTPGDLLLEPEARFIEWKEGVYALTTAGE